MSTERPRNSLRFACSSLMLGSRNFQYHSMKRSMIIRKCLNPALGQRRLVTFPFCHDGGRLCWLLPKFLPAHNKLRLIRAKASGCCSPCQVNADFRARHHISHHNPGVLSETLRYCLSRVGLNTSTSTLQHVSLLAAYRSAHPKARLHCRLRMQR